MDLHVAILTGNGLGLFGAEPWASYQTSKIAGCACDRNAGYVLPTPTSKETAS